MQAQAVSVTRKPAGDERLKVLVYTTLFPNSVQPLLGNFVMERMRHLRPFADLSVVAPVPYFPSAKVHARWSQYARIPASESRGGLNLDHPRFVVLPKIGMATHGFSMFLGSTRQVARMMRQGSYDLIDAHYVYPDGFAAILLGSLFHKPVVVSARGSDINVFSKFSTIRPLIRQVLKRADALIAVSDPIKNAMVELGCAPEKITVIGNGVDPAKFCPRPQAEMRQALGLPAGGRIALSVGNLTENKGFHLLIDAVARLRSHRPDLLLVVIGEGAYRSRLERRIRDAGVQQNVRLVGAVPHESLSAWYSAADVFCLASLTEGCPNVVLEAMACGRPVIVTRAAAQVAASRSMGLVVQRTAQNFERAIDQALDTKWNEETIAAHARSQSWERVASRVLNVFSDVVRRNRVCQPGSNAGHGYKGS